MKEENEPNLDSVKELTSNLEELEAKGVLLAQTNDRKLMGLIKDLRRELNRYEQDSSGEREKILDRLTPVIEKLEEILSGSHLEGLNNRIGKLRNKLASLERTEEKLREILENRSQLVKELRRENEALREEFIFSEKIEPGVRTLIKLRDNIAGQLQDTSSGGNDIFLEAVDDRLLDALKDFGVAEVETSGDEFDPACQEVVEKTEVLERRKDKKVLEVLQPGYRHNKKLIKPQKVVIGQFSGGETDEQN